MNSWGSVTGDRSQVADSFRHALESLQVLASQTRGPFDQWSDSICWHSDPRTHTCTLNREPLTWVRVKNAV